MFYKMLACSCTFLSLGERMAAAYDEIFFGADVDNMLQRFLKSSCPN